MKRRVRIYKPCLNCGDDFPSLEQGGDYLPVVDNDHLHLYAGGGNWIQKATDSIDRRGTEGKCTGSNFGGPGCPPGSRQYVLAQTFRKMAKEKKQTGGSTSIALQNTDITKFGQTRLNDFKNYLAKENMINMAEHEFINSGLEAQDNFPILQFGGGTMDDLTPYGYNPNLKHIDMFEAKAQEQNDMYNSFFSGLLESNKPEAETSAKEGSGQPSAPRQSIGSAFGTGYSNTRKPRVIEPPAIEPPAIEPYPTEPREMQSGGFVTDLFIKGALELAKWAKRQPPPSKSAIPLGTDPINKMVVNAGLSYIDWIQHQPRTIDVKTLSPTYVPPPYLTSDRIAPLTPGIHSYTDDVYTSEYKNLKVPFIPTDKWIEYRSMGYTPTQILKAHNQSDTIYKGNVNQPGGLPHDYNSTTKVTSKPVTQQTTTPTTTTATKPAVTTKTTPKTTTVTTSKKKGIDVTDDDIYGNGGPVMQMAGETERNPFWMASEEAKQERTLNDMVRFKVPQIDTDQNQRDVDIYDEARFKVPEINTEQDEQDVMNYNGVEPMPSKSVFDLTSPLPVRSNTTLPVGKNPVLATQESTRQNKGNTGRKLGVALDFATMIGRRLTEGDWNKKMENLTAAENVFTPMAGDRGFNTFNPVGFDPGTNGVPVQFKGRAKRGGQYQPGRVYELTDDEIQQIKRAGGQVRFV